MKIFVGLDKSRKYVFDNCKHSLENYNNSIIINPIGSSVLEENLYYRERNPRDSTEFSICRFLVPFISNYSGWSLFMDDDFIWKTDVNELLKYVDDNKSVLVCQHNYTSKQNVKWEKLKQYNYDKKNWSSLMLFNCSHPDCKKLNVETINTCDPLWLHQFKWTENVGSLPLEYNFLVGEYSNIITAKALHFTNGYKKGEDVFSY